MKMFLNFLRGVLIAIHAISIGFAFANIFVSNFVLAIGWMILSGFAYAVSKEASNG